MKKAGFLLTALIMSASVVTGVLAATDGVYTLSEESIYTWDGTDADRYKATSADYDYDYGDEASLSYSLPWPFTYYGQTYNGITVDTNGNIWFDNVGSAYSFPLPNAGKGPVIAALNNDLTSLYYGGFFIQHKIGPPERVVVEWQVETYSDEGTASLNNFEIVLFSDGTIKADYKSSSAVNSKDFGSGISKDYNNKFLSLTSNYVPAYNLSRRSFVFVPIPPVINVLFSGTGNGIVTSTPQGIACNANCSSTFPLATPITLHPEASQYSLFAGWTNGACSGIADCLLTLNSDTSVTAVFNYDTAHQVSIGNSTHTYYSTIQDAYNAVPNNDIIRLWSNIYTENLVCDRSIDVTLSGGYDSSYANITGDAVIRGTVSIRNGKVMVNNGVLRVR